MQKYLETRSLGIPEKTLEPSNSSSSILDESTDADNESVEKLPKSSSQLNCIATLDEEEERNL